MNHSFNACELDGYKLNWLVAKIEGLDIALTPSLSGGVNCITDRFKPSTNEAQGLPIMEREIHKIWKNDDGSFCAQIKYRAPYYSVTYGADIGRDCYVTMRGPTMLIAAMRCYVAFKLGMVVELPVELLNAMERNWSRTTPPKSLSV